MLLILLPSDAATICDVSLYGNPDPLKCSQVLLDHLTDGTSSLEIREQLPHFFAAADVDGRPPDVTIMEWHHRVVLAGRILKRGKWESKILHKLT